MQQVLVTGGMGYIGSHTVVALLKAGYQPTIVDNLSNSSAEVLNRIRRITGQEVPFFQVDIREREALNRIFSENVYDCVIHFAGLKAVGESVAYPLKYYSNNIGGTLTLLEVMARYNCKNIIFSSSATVYGKPEALPVTEDCPKGEITNPYGQTKAMQEQILMDLHRADPEWNVVALRYFNPIGAHESGLLGEAPGGIPNNLMPYITQVAAGKLPHLNVFGNDYATPDGTGVRDYVHVVDLAEGHIKAIKALDENWGFEVFNLGTGQGCSVLELVACFEKASGIQIPYVIQPRREGDVAASWADPTKAGEKLGWRARYDILKMCEDAWRWQKHHPDGYR